MHGRHRADHLQTADKQQAVRPSGGSGRQQVDQQITQVEARMSSAMPRPETRAPTISAARGERVRAMIPIAPITMGNSERTAPLRKALGEPIKSCSTWPPSERTSTPNVWAATMAVDDTAKALRTCFGTDGILERRSPPASPTVCRGKNHPSEQDD